MFSDLKGLPLQPHHTDSSPSPGTGVCLGQYPPVLLFLIKKKIILLFLQFLFKPVAHFTTTHNTHTKHHPISISLQVDFSFLWTALSPYSCHKEPEESHIPLLQCHHKPCGNNRFISIWESSLNTKISKITGND